MWDNAKEMKYVPMWVENAIVFVGLPIVILSILPILIPAFDAKEGIFIVLAVIAFVLFATKNSSSKNGIHNRQLIKVNRYRIWYKLNDEEHLYKLHSIEPDSLEINRKSYPNKLRWVVRGSDDTIEMPLISMSTQSKRSLLRVLRELC